MKLCRGKEFPAVTIIASILSAFLFFGCASARHKNGSAVSPVYITNSKRFYLLPPEDIERPAEYFQLLTGSFGEKSFVLQVFLQADEHGLFLSLLNDFGAGMGTLVYDGARISFDSSVFPAGIKAEYIAADLQFAYYKPSALKERLADVNLDFVITEENGAEIRRIMNGKKCIMQISKSGGTVDIENFLRGYRYNLKEASDL